MTQVVLRAITIVTQSFSNPEVCGLLLCPEIVTSFIHHLNPNFWGAQAPPGIDPYR